jgi:hypothetical protein
MSVGAVPSAVGDLGADRINRLSLTPSGKA